MTNQMLIIGLVLIGLFAALAIWRILKNHEARPNLLETLAVLGGTILCVLALTLENDRATIFDISEIATLASGIALIQIGVWGMWIRETPFQSRGFLSVGSGLVLIAAAIVMPMYVKATAPDTSIDVAAILSRTPDSFTILVSDSEQGATRMPTFSTPLPANVPMQIPTLAMPQLHFSTPTPTPELPEACEATVTTRLNMRDLPSTAGGKIITVIPENTTVELFGQDNVNEWWFTQFDGEDGWLNGSFLTFTDDDCSRLPVRNWAS